MTMHHFNYKLQDGSGNPIATISYGGDIAHKGAKLLVQISKDVPEEKRRETLEDFNSLAGVLKFNSELQGSTGVQVHTAERYPDALMLYIGAHFSEHHAVPLESFRDYQEAIKAHEAKVITKLQIAFAPVEALHHAQQMGNMLHNHGAHHTSHHDHHHEPAQEKAAMGTAALKEAPLRKL